MEYDPPLKPPVTNENCKLYLPIMQTFSFLITVSLSLDAMILKKIKNPVGGQSAVCYRCNPMKSIFAIFWVSARNHKCHDFWSIIEKYGMYTFNNNLVVCYIDSYMYAKLFHSPRYIIFRI